MTLDAHPSAWSAVSGASGPSPGRAARDALASSPRPEVACLVTRPLGAELDAALRGRARVTAFVDRLALVAHVRCAPVTAVVVALRDDEGRPTIGTVRALRAAAPRLPLFACCRLAEPDCRALLDFARAGGTDVLVQGTGFAALHAALAGRGDGTTPVATLVTRLVAAGVPPRFAPVLEFLILHVDDPSAPARASGALGVGRRALERQLARATLPPPRTLHGWCRLLVAAERLCGDGVTVERIAHDVGFSSGNALRNALQRYGATTPSAVRGGDGFATLVARLRDQLRAPPATSLIVPPGDYPLSLPAHDAGAALLVRETVAAWLARAVRAA